MATTGYKVLKDELTVLRDVSTLRNPITNEVTGYVAGLGETYYFDEIIPPELVSTDYKNILDDPSNPGYASLSRKLEPVDEDAREDIGRRLGLPFDGYDDLTEDEVLGALAVLPSVTQQRIKQYEAQGENRYRIVNYNSGHGEAPGDRAAGLLGSQVDVEAREAAGNKAAAQLTTRHVPEQGPVQPGEGITGTGDPVIPYGSMSESSDDDPEGDDDDQPKNAAAARRGRRPRVAGSKSKAKVKKPADEDSGDGDNS